MPRSGTLKQRITIQERTINNVLGDPIEVWSDVQDVWANIKTLRGDELFKLQQMNAKINVKIIMRPFPDLTVLHRIVHKNNVFNIVDIQDIDTAGTDYHVYCEEVRTSGS